MPDYYDADFYVNPWDVGSSEDYDFFDTSADAWDEAYGSSFLLSDFEISSGLGAYAAPETENSWGRIGDVAEATGAFLDSEAGSRGLAAGITGGLGYMATSAANDAANERNDRLYDYQYDQMAFDEDRWADEVALRERALEIEGGKLELANQEFQEDNRRLRAHNESIAEGPQREPRQRSLK